MALVELLAVGAGVAAAVHGDLFRGEPFVAPPVVAGVFEAPGEHFVPEPVFVKGAAELIDDLLLKALEEILGDFEDGALLGACEADIDHHGFGREADGEGDIGAEGAHDGFVGLAGDVVFEGFEFFAGLEAGEEDAVREVAGGEVSDFVGGGFEPGAEADLGDFGARDHVADLGARFVSALHEAIDFGDVAEVGDGGVEPGDAAGLGMAADVAEVQDLVCRDFLRLVFWEVERVGGGGAEAVELHAVVGILVPCADAADGFAADEADAGGAFFGLQELREEVAVDGDLAEDEALGGVEVDLRAGIECPGFGAVAVFKILVDFFVPSEVRGFRLDDDAGADGALRQMFDDVGGLGGVVVEPAGEAEDFEAGVGGEFALGVGGGNPDEPAVQRGLGGFEGGGLGVCDGAGIARAACSGAGATPT